MPHPESISSLRSLPVTVIFPMAGRGERFGTTFKPFLRIGDQTFIEAALGPFRKWQAAISRFVFVFLREQDNEFSVTERLKQMFEGLPWEAVILDHATAGPAETVAGAVERGAVTGPAIVCDCDHAVNVDPMFTILGSTATDACLLPVWDLAGEDVRSWSVAALGDQGAVTAIAEKAIPSGATRAAGVIGCYYFQDIAQVASVCRQEGYLVISEAVANLIGRGARVTAVAIQAAKFFGDPKRLARAVETGVPCKSPNLDTSEKT
jgi:CTP:molybdopterin cytidylyltransferase MocA